MDLFRKKSIDELQAVAAASGMLKNLAAVDLLMLGIGAVIGTGIFVLTGVAAAKYAGPAVPLSFILSGLTCALAGLAYAEFASIVPASGSAYTYAYASLGEFIAFIVGWNLILEYTVTSSAVAVGWSGYVVGLFASAGLVLPHELVVSAEDGGIFNLPAVLITLFLSFLLVRGTKESVKLNRILVFVKLAAIFLFLVLAAPHVDVTNWDPFLPFGYSGVVSGAAIVFFAYIGFDAVATTAEECRNAARDLPVGIIGSLFICTLLYAVVAAVLTGVVPYSMLDTAEPVAFALRHIGYNVGSAIVAVGAICGITTVLLVLLYGQSRIFFAMSRDGMVPANVCKIHRRFHTPYRVTILGAIFVSIIAGVFPIGMIAEMANIGTLSAFLIASVGVMVLRKTEPDLKRNFKCPAVWLIAPLAVLSCGYLMANLPRATWHRFGFWILFGLCVYFGYSRAHSVIGRRAAEEAAREEKR